MQRKLLFIHQGAIGDIVSLFPAIIKLKEKFRQIDAICNKNIGELACLLKITDKTYPVEAAFFSSLFSGKVDSVAAEILRSYDEILLFSYSAEFENTISSIIQKRIYRISPRPDATLEIHILSYILKFLAQNKLIDNDNLPEKQYHDYLTKEFGNRKAQHTESKIIIHPGSGSTRKNWPVSNYINVCENLDSKKICYEVIIGPAEYDLAEIFKKNLLSNIKIHRPAKLSELVPLLKQSREFIGNDSGISHLAAFMGIPAILIFGPSNPKRWKPFGRFVQILRSQTGCIPCFETGKQECKDPKCLNGITPEIVLKTLYSGMLKHNIAP
ncbi:MAG: glycosyltransferase family 9 protein [Desulfobacterales bacterium]